MWVCVWMCATCFAHVWLTHIQIIWFVAKYATAVFWSCNVQIFIHLYSLLKTAIIAIFAHYWSLYSLGWITHTRALCLHTYFACFSVWVRLINRVKLIMIKRQQQVYIRMSARKSSFEIKNVNALKYTHILATTSTRGDERSEDVLHQIIWR